MGMSHCPAASDETGEAPEPNAPPLPLAPGGPRVAPLAIAGALAPPMHLAQPSGGGFRLGAQLADAPLRARGPGLGGSHVQAERARELYDVPEAGGAFDAAYFQKLERYSLASPERALAVRSLRDGEAARQARLELIAGAHRSLVLSSYAIIHDAYGVELIDALTEAAERGVAVILTLDAVADRIGSLGQSGAEDAVFYRALERLEAAGGFVSWYATASQQLERFGGGNHFKAMVADGERAIMGGRNVGREYVDDWTDFDMWLEGPVAAQIASRTLDVIRHSRPFERRPETRELRAAYSEAYEQARRDVALGRYRGRQRISEARGRDERVSAPFYLVTWDPTFGPTDYELPEDVDNPITSALIATFDRAERSITLSSNYVWAVPQLQEAIMRAARRGVTVTVVTTAEQASPGLALTCYLGTREQYAALEASGVQIREAFKHEHGKMYLVDDRIAAFGSYNMEYAADLHLVEGLLFTTDEQVVREIKRSLEDTIDNRTLPVPAPEPSSPERGRRILMRIFNGVVHYFV